MSSYEWMELQTLTQEIDTARARLADARKRRDVGRVRAMEEEISRAEKRRLQLVAHISTNIATAAEPPPRGKPAAEPVETVIPAPIVRAAPARAAEEALPAATAETPEPETAAAAGADVAEAEASVVAADQVEPEPPPAELAAADEPIATAEAEAVAPPAEEASPEQDEPTAAGAAAPPASAPRGRSSEGGINVWDQLTPNDLDRAKRELGLRRAEMLARHAEELKGLEAEQGQLDTLEQAIAAFLQKFSRPAEGEVVKLDQERELRQQGNN